MVRREEAEEKKKDSNPHPLPLIHPRLDEWMNGRAKTRIAANARHYVHALKGWMQTRLQPRHGRSH